ncbi:NAD-dependent epimerase/dehydratase family protein [Agromyces subbeticus]|uniref:NAD-dependent epimerase/dehydratase family protein n=1 Tax=Agromyces subbeticus TaxID=293890 RepID=UPI0003B3BE80|nr:NAD(P)-dependent oxidoreductase [Agromyces subbeticus]
MKVLVAGATGTIGGTLVAQLLASGHAVYGLTRSKRGAQRLNAAGADAVVVDLLDADRLLTSLDGRAFDAIIHQATAITGMPTSHRSLYATDALREQGTINLMRIAESTGATRFITQSFFHGYGYRDHGSEPVAEDGSFGELTGHRGIDRHMRALRLNEQLVLQTPGIDGIALRYGMFYGPEPMTMQLASWTRRRLLPVFRPSGVTSPIHISDAASAAVAALTRGRPGQAYNIADECPVGFDDYVRALAHVSGAPQPLTLPAWSLRAVPYVHTLMVGTSIRLSTVKARDELNWTPIYPSIHEGLASL